MSNEDPNKPVATPIPDKDKAHARQNITLPFRIVRNGVAFKLIGLLFIMVALILGGILAIFSVRLSNSARQQADQRISDSASTLSESFQLWLEGSQNALFNLAAQPGIRSMQPELQEPILKALAQTHQYMFLVSTIAMDGMNVARSDGAPLVSYADRTWFLSAIGGEKVSYWTQIGSTLGKPVLVVATPIRRSTGSADGSLDEGEIIGVTMFQADLGEVSRIVEQFSLGTSGMAYIIDPTNRVIAHTRPEYSARMEDLSTYPPVAALRQGQQGLQTIKDAAGVQWRAASILLPGGWGLVVQQTVEDATASLRTEQRLVIILAAAALLLTLIVVWLAVRQNLRPISELSAAAKAISEGNFYRQASVRTNDEFALLADVFNRMEIQMRDMVESLEQRVADRTRSLERRTSQLEAAAQVARSAAGIRDLSQLFSGTVQLISKRFGFYHAGIFIIDEIGEFAVLQAANSPGGQRMLDRGHQLRVGQVGIVGYVASSGRPRIALDVGEDAVFFNNPDLPQTRSEMALPLKVSGKVIGVLDVQSIQSNAFVQEDVDVLQLLADQIALAIESARRLQESQQALAELNAIYGERTRQSWQDRLHNRGLAYHYDRTAVDAAGYGQVTAISPVGSKKQDEPVDQGRLLEIPISFRDQGLGAIRLRRAPDQQPWTEEEQELVRDAVTQIAPALENARLLEEIQQRAHHETLIANFSSRVQTSLDLETLLRTAVSEIGDVFKASRVRIRMTGSVNSEQGGDQGMAEGDN